MKHSSTWSEQDWWEPLRRVLVPTIDKVLRMVGLRAVAHVYPAEYAATVDMGEEALEEWLEARGFTRNPLAAYKTTPDDRKESGSWRRTDDEGWQLHVMLFDAENRETDVYAHREVAWTPDAFTPSGIRQNIAHYTGKGQSGPEGVRRFRGLLDEDGVPYEVDVSQSP